MKFTVNIEETINQDFIIEAETPEEALCKARAEYEKGSLILDNALLTSKKIAVIFPEKDKTSWSEF